MWCILREIARSLFWSNPANVLISLNLVLVVQLHRLVLINDTKQFTEFKISSFVLVVRCRDPGSPINGKQVNTKNHYNYEDTLEFACNDNYTLEGYRQIKCKETKHWSEDVPSCRGNLNYVNFYHFVEAIIFLDLYPCVFTLGEMVSPLKTFKTGSQKNPRSLKTTQKQI